MYRLGQLRPGFARIGHFMPSYNVLCQVRIGLDRLGHVSKFMPGYAWLGEFRHSRTG